MGPEAADLELEAMAKRLLGSSLECRERSRLDPVYGYDFEHDYALVGPVEAGALQEMRRALADALVPAPGPMIAKELARLGMITKVRAEEVDEIKLRMAIFAEEMAAYPADVVVDACRFWGRTEKFFPSWAELKDLLDVRVKRRKRLAAAVGHAG
jgi:hypothetical protein